METQKAMSGSEKNSSGGENMRRSLPINKSSSTSNIPTTRRVFNTTLHLRKSAVIPESNNNNKGNGVRVSLGGGLMGSRENKGLKPSRIAVPGPRQHEPVGRKTQNGNTMKLQNEMKRKLEKSERDVMSTEKAFEVLGLNNKNDGSDDLRETEEEDGDMGVGSGFESKMVRSSTFSKDFPDLSQSIEIS